MNLKEFVKTLENNGLIRELNYNPPVGVNTGRTQSPIEIAERLHWEFSPCSFFYKRIKE